MSNHNVRAFLGATSSIGLSIISTISFMRISVGQKLATIWFVILVIPQTIFGIGYCMRFMWLIPLRVGSKLNGSGLATFVTVLTTYAVTISSYVPIYVGRIIDMSERSLSPYTALYFSIMTITTTGYGDVVPMHGIARIAASFEVLTGYVFLALFATAINTVSTHFQNK